jgi:hypothetical protein
MATTGKVVLMTGPAKLVKANGEVVDLKIGDTVEEGDKVETPTGVAVDLDMGDGSVVQVGPNQLVTMSPELSKLAVPDQLDASVDGATIRTVIQAIEDGSDINKVLDSTAAGNVGNITVNGFDFVELLRINLDLTKSTTDTSSVTQASIEVGRVSDAVIKSSSTSFSSSTSSS